MILFKNINNKIAVLNPSKTCVRQLDYLYSYFDKIAVQNPSKICVRQLDYLSLGYHDLFLLII